MAVDIVTKNSATTTSEPAPGSLQQGELAANVTDGKLWVGNSSGDPQPLVGVGGGAWTEGTDPADIVNTNSGNVGIGTTAPTVSLEVAGITSLKYSSPVFRLSNTSIPGSATNLGRIRFYAANSLDAEIEGARIQVNAEGAWSDVSAPTMMKFYTTPSGSTSIEERMRIDSAGNVGLGTTNPTSKLHIEDTADVSVRVRAGTLTNYSTIRAQASDWDTSFADTSILQYGISATGTTAGISNAELGILGFQNGSAGLVVVNGSKPLIFATASVERMRIKSDGNVGIGTNNPGTALHIVATEAQLRIQDTISGVASKPTLQFRDGSGTIGNIGYLNGSNNILHIRANSVDGAIRFDTGGTSERMRIDSSGNLLVGGTALDPALNNAYHSQISSGGQLQLSTNLGAALTTNRQAVGGSHWQLYSGGSGNPSGGVTTDGTTPSFFNNSDESLKENIVDMAPQLANVMALRPRNFDMKETGINHDGFIAQEVVKVWPDRVRVDEDSEILQLMDLSKTDARIIKAIQEQQSMITELTTRLEALEA